MPPLAKFITRRVILGVLTLLAVSLIVFLATQALPGNAARALLGQQATPQAVKTLERELHLNESPFVQYGRWIGGVVHGDFGRSLATQEPVTAVLKDRILNTSFLILVAALVAIPLSVFLGVLTAIRRDRAADDVISTGLLVFAATPEFVVAIVLVLLLATNVTHVLPAISVIPAGGVAWDYPSSVVLPAAALVLAVTPYISRMVRSSLIEVLESDYVGMARLNGLSERRVIYRHALPNAVVPAIQVSALQLAWMAGGVMTVEFVFNYPGVGSELVNAVGARDIPVVQAITLFLGAVYVALNLVADIACILATPRLRTALR